jgi:O-antigen ligase
VNDAFEYTTKDNSISIVVFISFAIVAIIAGAWNTTEPNAVFPQILGVIAFGTVIVGLFVIAPEWLIAILALGQPFLNMGFAFLGGANRATPFALPLLLLGFLGGIIFLMQLKGGLFMTNGILDATKSRWENKGLVITSIAIAGILFFGSTYSASQNEGLRKAAGYVMFNLVPFMLIVMYVKGQEGIRRLLIALTCVGMAISIFTLADVFWSYGGIPSWGLRYGKHNFLGLRLEGGIWFGRRVGLTLLSVIAASFISNKPMEKAFALLLAPFLLVIVFLSSRGPFFALIPALLIFAISSQRGLSKLSSVTLYIILPIAALVGLIRWGEGSASFAPSAVNRYEDLFHSGLQTQRYYRLNYWNSSWQVFKSHPMLGIGTAGWASRYKGVEVDPSYVHNIFLEFAAELGIVGLTLFLIFLYCALKSARRLISEAKFGLELHLLSVWAVSILIMALLNACLSGDIYRNDHIWIAAGIIYQLSSASAEEEINYESSQRDYRIST